LDAVPYVETITTCREIAGLGPAVFDRNVWAAGPTLLLEATVSTGAPPDAMSPYPR
jgi:hypothetical protein